MALNAVSYVSYVQFLYIYTHICIYAFRIFGSQGTALFLTKMKDTMYSKTADVQTGKKFRLYCFIKA